MHFIRQLFQLLFAVVFNLAQIFFNGFLHNWFDLERGFDCLVVLLVNSMRQGGEQKKELEQEKIQLKTMNHVPRPPCQVPCRQDQTFHLPF